jgi:glutathione reductase (NADPH)
MPVPTAKRTHVKKVDKQADGTLTITADVGGQETQITGVDCLLWAIGRVPQSDILNLPAAGVEVDQRGYIKVRVRTVMNSRSD